MKTTRFIKLFYSLLLMAYGTITMAGPQGMDEQQMQQMMQQAEAMQKCFENIDPSAYENLEAKGKQMESDIKALCAAGKRDEAMSKAMKYGMEINNDPQLKEIRKCSEMMKGMMANMPQPYIPPTTDENSDEHICDGM